MELSESIKELSIAMNKFQEKVVQPSKNAKNPFFKSNYVTLENVMACIKKYAIPEGLSYSQELINDESGKLIGVRTIVTHTSGEFIKYDPFFLPNEKNTAQSGGSAATYGRRYSLSAAFGISSDEDDDGNEASGNAKPKTQSNARSNHNPKNSSSSKSATQDDVNRGILALQKNFQLDAQHAYQEMADYIGVDVIHVKEQSIPKQIVALKQIYKKYEDMKEGLPNE